MRLEENAPALEPPPGLAARRGRMGDEDVLLLEWPEPAAAVPPALTGAEREVLARLAGGASNGEIAAVRGTSPRTVAKQVAAVFEKLGVHSRAEVAALLPLAGCARAARGGEAGGIDRARGAGLPEASPGQALELWRRLVNGRWSIVAHADRDGRRFLLARRSAPGVPGRSALTAAERGVVAHATLGRSNKFIAYVLGLSPSTIAEHLQRAERKLGLSSRHELIRLFACARPPRDPPRLTSAAAAPPAAARPR